MVRSRKGLARLAAAATALALVLTGCSSGAGGGDATPGERLPDDRQNLTYILNYGCTSLDPTENFDNCRMQMGTNVFDTLVTLDSKSQPQPKLATSWEWTDPTTLQFKLREGVTFSDGTPFTSADVKATFDRYIAMKSVLATQLAVVSSYKADDPTTFTIRTSAPTGTLLGVLSMIFIGQEKRASDDNYWAKPIGTGPFVISDFVANDHITLTRNDTYWGTKAQLKTLTFKVVTDTNARITALSNGSAQVVAGVTNDQIPTVREMSDVAFSQIPSYTYTFLWFQNSRAPFNDVKVRRALWQALDLEKIVKALLGETADTMTALCPSAAFGCVAPSNAPKHDPEAAKRLLAEAGYPNGFDTTIDYSVANTGYDQIVAAMISDWKAIGVNVTPKSDDQATFLKNIASPGDFDMIVNSNLTTTGDADFTLNRLYPCSAKRLGYCNEELDALLAKARETTDLEQRKPLYQQAADILAEDVPALGLFENNINVAAKKTVQGLTLTPTENYDWSAVYLTE
jgi:peptide/nickel transport system substrate-binding protein